jgi:hypothetical protein
MAAKQLPPVGKLFSDSWALLKANLKNLIILNLIGFGITVLTLIVIVILGIIFGLTAQFSHLSPSTAGTVLYTMVPLLIALFLVFFVIGTWFNVASILIVANTNGKLPATQALKNASKLVVPALIVGILSFLYIMGGFFLLIIPGIILSILFTFAIYEVVLNNQTGINALKRSVLIYSNNFLGIFGRVILIGVIGWGIQMLISFITPHEGLGQGLISLVSLIISVVYSWFALCYIVLLYKEASAGLEGKEGSNLMWAGIIAVIGWVFGGFIIYNISQNWGTFMESFMRGYQSGSGQMYQNNQNIYQVPMTQEEYSLPNTDTPSLQTQ